MMLYGNRRSGSLDRGASAGNGFGRRDELGAPALNCLDAPLDLVCPEIFDFTILEEAGNELVCQARPLLCRELERLSFYDFELACHGLSIENLQRPLKELATARTTSRMLAAPP